VLWSRRNERSCRRFEVGSIALAFGAEHETDTGSTELVRRDVMAQSANRYAATQMSIRRVREPHQSLKLARLWLLQTRQAR